jgi:hypothetical protein
MRQDEIKAGRTYSNGKGRERKVLELGGCPRDYSVSRCVRYQVVMGPDKGQVFVITLRKFAAWAKHEVFENEGETK